jgi:CelD/BcsL family acetyltransferase involved in cellulose biosynthesis
MAGLRELERQSDHLVARQRRFTACCDLTPIVGPTNAENETRSMPAALRFNAYEDGYADAAVTEARPLVSHAMAAGVAISISDTLSAVETEWRTFEESADCTAFQTFDWLSTWQRCVGVRQGVTPAIIAGRDKGGELLFILPLSVGPAPFARELTFFGTDLCDYNAPLLAPRFVGQIKPAQFSETWRNIAAQLQRDPRWRHDLVRLEKMPEMVGGQLNPMLSVGVTPHPSGAYATPLTGTWDAFYAAKRSASTRRRDRTKRNRLADFGEVKTTTPDSTDGLLQALSVLMQQKGRSLARMGIADFFARPGYADFYRALVTDPRNKPLVHVSQLDVGSHAAAVNVALTFRDTYYHIMSSYTDGDMARFGPGAIHMHDVLRNAIERGFKVFDFTVGDEPYKRDWCESGKTLYDHLGAARMRGVVIVASMTAMQALKRRIKQTPTLWAAFKKLRAWIGPL